MYLFKSPMYIKFWCTQLSAHSLVFFTDSDWFSFEFTLSVTDETDTRFISKVMHTPPKIDQIYSFKSIFTLRRSMKYPLVSMTHLQWSGSFLTPSSRPLEFSSRICQVMDKFRSFKVWKRRPLNGSFNFMAGTHVWRIRGWSSTSHA